MRRPVVYLNELSASFGRMATENIVKVVIQTIESLRAAQHIRGDLTLSSNQPLTHMTFGAKRHTLSGLLGNENHESWQMLKAIAVACPYTSAPAAVLPGEDEEIVHGRLNGIGMTWAWKNRSLIVSFGHRKPWEDDRINVVYRKLENSGRITRATKVIENISHPSHAVTWKMILRNVGFSISSSSLVYESIGFAMRMYFDDHGFPHVHVLSSRSSRKVLLKIRIDNCATLDGEVNGSKLKEIVQLIESNKAVLLENWERCRRGDHLIRL